MRRPRIVIAGLLSTAVIVAGALTLPVSIFQSNSADADVSTATTAEGELLPPLWDDDTHPFKCWGRSWPSSATSARGAPRGAPSWTGQSRLCPASRQAIG